MVRNKGDTLWTLLSCLQVSSEDNKGKTKAPAKNTEGERSDANESEEIKVPSRQSKRNVNKVITYRDEDLSEDETPPKRGGRSNKKAKNDEESDVSIDSEGNAAGGIKSKAKNRSANKKKPRSHDSEDEQDADDSLSEEEFTTKVSKSKEKVDKPPQAKKSKVDKPLLNKTQSDYESLDFSSDKTTSDGKLWNLKISSWNVGGLKAWVKVRFLHIYFSLGIIVLTQMDRRSGRLTNKQFTGIENRCTVY